MAWQPMQPIAQKLDPFRRIYLTGLFLHQNSRFRESSGLHYQLQKDPNAPEGQEMVWMVLVPIKIEQSYAILPASAPQPQTQTPTTLSTLPDEIKLQVFEFLNQVDSACLGLSQKAFYGIHREIHGSVSLEASTTDEEGNVRRLHELLHWWVGPDLLFGGNSPGGPRKFELKEVSRWRGVLEMARRSRERERQSQPQGQGSGQNWW